MADDTLSTSAPLAAPACPLPAPFPQLPAGGLHFLSGASGVGKTAFIASMAAAIARGEPFCGAAPNPALPGQAILSLDREWSENRQWFARAGYPDIPSYSLIDDLSVDINQLATKLPARRMAILEAALDRFTPALAPGTLLYVDPVSYFVGNLMDYDQCMIGCTLLRRVLKARQLTLVGLMHAGKQRSDPKDRYLRLQDRIIGSMAIYGYSDTQMYLASPVECDAAHYTFLWHPHMTEAEEVRLSRTATGLFIPFVTTESTEHNAILKILPHIPSGLSLKLLYFGLAKVGIELSKQTVLRRLDDLMKAGLVEKVSHGVYGRVKPS